MRAFKNLDYFRKISPEHTKPTLIGGIVSILSLTVCNYKLHSTHKQVHLPLIL